MLYKYAASGPRQMRNALAGKYLFIFFMSFAVLANLRSAMSPWGLLALPLAGVWAALWYRDAKRLRSTLDHMKDGGVTLDGTGLEFVGLYDGAKLPFTDMQSFSVRRLDGPKSVILKRKGQRALRILPLEDTDAFAAKLELYLPREKSPGLFGF